MRPVPDSRTVSHHELESVGAAMDGYMQSAAEAVTDHGDTITDTHGWALAAAYMIGAAAIHAAELKAESLAPIARELERLADAHERHDLAVRQLTHAVSELGAVAVSIAELSGSVEVHSDSVDRLADAVETRSS